MEMEKVIDIEERIPSMREKRRKKANFKFIFIIAIFLFALLVILYFQSSFSRINSIHVKGGTLHETTFYEEESGLSIDGSFWDFSTKGVKQELEKIDSVEEAKVSRKWINNVEIAITEWQTVAYVENAGRYNALLENGEVFSEEIIVPENKAPILNGFTDEKIRDRMTKQLLKMDKNVYAVISEVIFTGSDIDQDSITAFMDDGYEIHAAIPSFAEKMAYYEDIISQLTDHEKGVIDIEVGTFFTPFTKKYGNAEEEEEEEDDEIDE